MAKSYDCFTVVKTLDGQPPKVEAYPLVAGTYYKGDVIRLSATSGSARVMSAAAATTVLGVMNCDVTTANSVTGKYEVVLADANTIFEAKMLASKAPQTMVGDTCDIVIGSTHNFRLQGTSSAAQCKIFGFHPDESTSAHTGGRYWVQISKFIFAQSRASNAY